MFKIKYATKELIPSFYKCLHEIALEKIYLEITTAPLFELVEKFQSNLIDQNKPVFYALDDKNNVVGWVDIGRKDNPTTSHRGSLGMGVLKRYRDKGIGKALLSASIEHSKKIGLEQIELSVYTSNLRALKLYKKFGFKQTGLIANYRKVNGMSFDAIQMVKDLRPTDINKNPSAKKLWNDFINSTQSKIPKDAHIIVFYAGTAQTTDALLALYKSGKKYASSSVLEEYQISGESLPFPNKTYWIVLNSKDQAEIILKTTRVEINPFDSVSAEIAKAEGEGDLSLDYWRTEHIKFFTPFLESWGVDDIRKTTIVTEYFDLVFQI